MAVSTKEKIAKRAYELFLQRNGENRTDFDEWLQAEREILGSKQPREGKKNVEKVVAKTSPTKKASTTTKKDTAKPVAKTAPTKPGAAKKAPTKKVAAKKKATKKSSKK